MNGSAAVETEGGKPPFMATTSSGLLAWLVVMVMALLLPLLNVNKK